MTGSSLVRLSTPTKPRAKLVLGPSSITSPLTTTVPESTSVARSTSTELRTSGRSTSLRGRVPTYTHNAPKHTERYIAEGTVSFNHRELNDLERMVVVASTVSRVRLTHSGAKASYCGLAFGSISGLGT